MCWHRLGTAVTSPRSWLIALFVVLASGLLVGVAGAGDSASKSPVQLPASAESARAAQAVARFPGGDRAPAILVVTRTDVAPLGGEDLAAAAAAADRMSGSPPAVSNDGRAALSAAPLNAQSSGFALGDA